MKTMKNITNRSTVALALTALLMTACNSSIPLSANGNGDNNNAPKMEKAGIASFRTIRNTMAKALGVSLATNPVPCQTVFDNVKSNLSEKFDSANYSDAAYDSTYQLAGCFCNQFASNAGLRQALLPSVNFGAAPSALTPAVKADIANAFIDAAWNPALKSSADVQDVVTLLNEIVPLAPASAAGTQAGVEAACRTGLGSNATGML
mgnify:CR=1 FL=1